ncbi:MAG: hypothetical protein B9S38_12485 [Verrucomicrobiia bacterium Tous-C4TDCM]|nr:MAG: hypothetical protein B9S38_12485 [Verrucomicrobiae bacterium Tous-C4TDCM]
MRPALILLVLIAGCFAISRDSFWMDEAGGVFRALIPDLGGWWKMTLHMGGSDIQMPAYMLSLWAWARAFDQSELAFRAINLIWLGALIVPFRNLRLWPLVCLLSPFVFTYLGELRPYLMQMAAAALAAAGLARVIDDREQEGYAGLHLLFFGCLLLCLSSLTSAIWAFGAGVALLVLRPGWLRQGGFWLRSLPWILAAAAGGGYYTFTLLKGYRAASAGEGGLLSVGFGLYEMLGLAGLGPDRNAIRSAPAVVIRWLPLIVPAFAVISAAWWLGLRDWLKAQPARVLLSLALALGIPVAILLFSGVFFGFRILGRHLSPAIVVLLLPLAQCLELGLRGRRIPLVIGSTAMLFWLASCLVLRFDSRHAKDDYRRATLMAYDLYKDDRRIWWLADMNAPRYYVYRRDGIPAINAIQPWETSPPASLGLTDYVFVNRPDLRFQGRDHQAILTAAKFKLVERFSGFEVWKSGYLSD